LFLRLNADVNERLRAMLRYQGELSRYIDEALFRLGWKWKERSAVKITERTREEAKKALHRRREGRHPEAAFAGEGADLKAL
jgi:hypothetical protein